MLALSYQQFFKPVFDEHVAKVEMAAETWAGLAQLTMTFVLIVLLSAVLFVIARRLDTRTIGFALDRGSVVAQVAKLPKDFLAEAARLYKASLKQTHDYRNLVFEEIQPYENSFQRGFLTRSEALLHQKLSEEQETQRLDAACYLRRLASLFQGRSPVLPLAVLIAAAGILFICAQAQMDCFLEDSFRYSSLSHPNRFRKSEMVPQSFFPSDSPGDAALEIAGMPVHMTKRYRTLVNPHQSQLQKSLYFIFGWIDEFRDVDQLTQDQRERFLEVPLAQIFYLKNVAHMHEKASAREELDDYLSQLHSEVC